MSGWPFKSNEDYAIGASPPGHESGRPNAVASGKELNCGCYFLLILAIMAAIGLSMPSDDCRTNSTGAIETCN